MIKVPFNKIQKARLALNSVITSNKIRLRNMQAMLGLLNFIAKAIPAGRAFNRRFYDAMVYAKQPYHFARITTEFKQDASVWLEFVDSFNGLRIFNENEWLDNKALELYTDSAGSQYLGCGCYFNGMWSYFKWPGHWDNKQF